LIFTSGPQKGKKLQSIWQILYSPENKLLTWAWGSSDGQPPKSYESAMVEPDNQEFVFASCIINDKSICNFDH